MPGPAFYRAGWGVLGSIRVSNSQTSPSLQRMQVLARGWLPAWIGGLSEPPTRAERRQQAARTRREQAAARRVRGCIGWGGALVADGATIAYRRLSDVLGCVMMQHTPCTCTFLPLQAARCAKVQPPPERAPRLPSEPCGSGDWSVWLLLRRSCLLPRRRIRRLLPRRARWAAGCRRRGCVRSATGSATRDAWRRTQRRCRTLQRRPCVGCGCRAQQRSQQATAAPSGHLDTLLSRFWISWLLCSVAALICLVHLLLWIRAALFAGWLRLPEPVRALMRRACRGDACSIARGAWAAWCYTCWALRPAWWAVCVAADLLSHLVILLVSRCAQLGDQLHSWCEQLRGQLDRLCRPADYAARAWREQVDAFLDRDDASNDSFWRMAGLDPHAGAVSSTQAASARRIQVAVKAQATRKAVPPAEAAAAASGARAAASTCGSARPGPAAVPPAATQSAVGWLCGLDAAVVENAGRGCCVVSGRSRRCLPPHVTLRSPHQRARIRARGSLSRCPGLACRNPLTSSSSARPAVRGRFCLPDGLRPSRHAGQRQWPLPWQPLPLSHLPAPRRPEAGSGGLHGGRAASRRPAARRVGPPRPARPLHGRQGEEGGSRALAPCMHPSNV